MIVSKNRYYYFKNHLKTFAGPVLVVTQVSLKILSL